MNLAKQTELTSIPRSVDVKLSVISCVLLLTWLFLPFIVWVGGVLIYAFSTQKARFDNVLVTLVIVSLSILIASRQIGYLWGGADDMPSYLMAFEHYNNFGNMLATSLLYAKHADALFGLYSWAVAALTNNHAFLYYFITLFLTYFLIWKFCQLVHSPSPLICFLLVVLFYKFFQAQWHLIRACMAVPILLYAIFHAQNNKKQGVAIFIIGGLIHFSTSFLLLPLLVFNKQLSKKWSVSELANLIIGFILVAVFGVIAVKVLGSVINHYMLNKILTRLVFEPSFSKLPSLAFFMFINLIALPGYLKTNNKNYIRLFNIASFLCLLSFVALFFIGDELHRILLPLYLLYAPLMLFGLKYISPKILSGSFVFIVMVFHLFAFSYVLFINESDFFHQDSDYRHPIENRGIDYLLSFKYFYDSDISYYDGYRNK